ncbi:MAG: hypothetical protein KKE17_11380 [Proteobacteria bacterium]|nr:hypothetical protein [Pseudomonadota bacterium]MBU1710596.1 hypothetical protein [Pseudomonadota bacterium]
MEKIIKELRSVFLFKDNTLVGDIVLIVAEKPQAMLYALVTDIQRDESRLDEWWHVSLQVLSFPPKKTMWTLRLPQFTGKEFFTMGGESRFIQAIRFDSPGEEKDLQVKGKKKKTVLRVVK